VQGFGRNDIWAFQQSNILPLLPVTANTELETTSKAFLFGGNAKVFALGRCKIALYCFR